MKMNRKARRAEKFRAYSPVRAKGGEAEDTKVGVEKGFGPRHASNSKEGTDLTKINSDVVPAMLTPREAVLNRNAAEMAGRGNIEALNKEGNLLASKGVDLAGGETMNSKQKPKKLAGGDASLGGYGPRDFPHPMAGKMHPGYGFQPQPLETGGPEPYQPGLRPTSLGGSGIVGEGTRNFPHPNAGLMHPGYAGGLPPAGLGGGGASLPGYGGGGSYGEPPGSYGANMKGYAGGMGNYPGQKPMYGNIGPSLPPGQNWGGGGFYPPGQGLNKGYGFAEGSAEVPGGIGTPNPQKSYSDQQVDFKAPDLSGFIRALHEEGKKQGLSESQMAGIAKQFGGMGGYGGGGSGYANLSPSAGEDFGNPNYIGLGTPSYQGGISEVGYPPGIAPNAVFSYDEGGWTGPLDPRWSSPGYARGTSGVDFDYIPPWADPTPIPGNTGPRGFGRPSTMAGGGDHSGYGNRSSWMGGAPGMPWSPTMIPTTYNPQGYPYAVPVQGPDQNLQGVGRTHNLRKNQ